MATSTSSRSCTSSATIVCASTRATKTTMKSKHCAPRLLSSGRLQMSCVTRSWARRCRRCLVAKQCEAPAYCVALCGKKLSTYPTFRGGLYSAIVVVAVWACVCDIRALCAGRLATVPGLGQLCRHQGWPSPLFDSSLLDNGQERECNLNP